MYKIRELCGVNNYLAKFDRNLDLKKIEELFKDEFKVKFKGDNIIKFESNGKSFTVYDFGEIFFNGFEKEEVEEICEKIEENI